MTTRPEPAGVGHAPRQGSLLRRMHRLSALPLAAYALPHLTNHVVAVGGIERHIAFMRVMRQVVRVPAVEVLLLACVVCQIMTGLVMVVRRRRTRGGWLSRGQALAGACLAFFLAVHVGAVLYARLWLGLDTNFYFAAAGLRTAPFPLFFVPYYGAAIVALAVHLACALRPRDRERAGLAGITVGAMLAVAIVATFSGALYPVEIPPAYLATLRPPLP